MFLACISFIHMNEFHIHFIIEIAILIMSIFF